MGWDGMDTKPNDTQALYCNIRVGTSRPGPGGVMVCYYSSRQLSTSLSGRLLTPKLHLLLCLHTAQSCYNMKCCMTGLLHPGGGPQSKRHASRDVEEVLSEVRCDNLSTFFAICTIVCAGSCGM